MSATHHPSAVTNGEESNANFSGDKQWETSKQNFAKLGGEVSQRPGVTRRLPSTTPVNTALEASQARKQTC